MLFLFLRNQSLAFYSWCSLLQSSTQILYVNISQKHVLYLFLWIEVANQWEVTANEMGFILLCMCKLQGYFLSRSMLGTDPLVLSPDVHYSVMINILERICCSELFLTQFLFVCLGWKRFCLVCYFSEFLPKKQRKLSFLVAFFIRYESGLDSRTDGLLTWLKNLQYLFFQVKCLSKTFHKSDSLTCTFIRSLLHFFFPPAFLISEMTMMVFEISENFCIVMKVVNRGFFF